MKTDDGEPQSSDGTSTVDISNPPVAPVSADDARLQQEGQVHVAAEDGNRDAANLTKVKGISAVEITQSAIDSATGVISSDSFGLVLGYVEKLVDAGDALSEVNEVTPPNAVMHAEPSPDPPLGQARMEYFKHYSQCMFPIIGFHHVI